MVYRSIVGIFLVGCAVLTQSLTTFGIHHHGKHGCPQCGCMEIQWVEVTKQQCKMVTEKVPIKKTVYETKQIPYCGHAMSGHHGQCCPKCAACPRMKTVLIKKEIKCGEKTETKCVAEEIKVLVPMCCPKCGYQQDSHHVQASDKGTDDKTAFEEVKIQQELTATTTEPISVESDPPPSPPRISQLPLPSTPIIR